MNYLKRYGLNVELWMVFSRASAGFSHQNFLCILHILGRVYNKIVAYYAPTYTALHKLILIPINAQTQKLKEMY